MKHFVLVIKLLLLTTFALLSACTLSTPMSTSTPTITPIPTSTPKPTLTPTPTVELINYPFVKVFNCPDPNFIIQNDSFNGPFKNRFGEFYGHFDLSPSCESHDVYSPFSGFLDAYGTGETEGQAHLILDDGINIKGIENALIYSGIENPALEKIDMIRINFGHVNYSASGSVEAGEKIGELLWTPYWPYWRFGFQVSVFYSGTEYMISPDLFDHTEWVCHPNIRYDCEPEPHDYAP